MFRVHMLPAKYGDALWVEYGEASKPRRIMIDAGTSGAFPKVRERLESLPADQREFELLVVTHIDIDHIGGIIPLLDAAPSLGVTFREIWFNGYRHLTDILGAKDGERLTSRILEDGYAWNKRFGERAIVVPDDGDLPRTNVKGLEITILSPGWAQLAKLEKEWDETIRAAGLEPGVGETVDPEELDDLLGDLDVETLADSLFRQDTTAPNGSSIAFVASYGGTSVLFGADAFPSVLRSSLLRMTEKERDAIRVLKVSHHGSRKNLDNQLLDLLRCDTFLFSSNGARYKHPNPESIARVVRRGGARLKFNYASDFTKPWNDKDLKKKWDYTTEYGDEDGLTIEL